MGGILSKPKVAPAPAPEPAPPPEPLPPPPERSSDEVAAAAERQRKRYYGGQGGRAMNMLTGGLGVPSASTSAAVRMLGGVGKV
ncbi:hypothetical protein [Tepidimonas sp.]|uniref:hypothetical protein n=1 Tax=Tepidimonas sp. TaxID=2002775 RepID=UPI003918A4A2